MEDEGMMSRPKRGKKKRNGEYVLPKSVVEYHGISRMKDLENEAHWAMLEEELPDPECCEEEKEDDKDPQEKKPKKTKSKGFAIKSRVKTAYIK